ncbi:hypothetical protein BJY01DRAFT_122306 [Aspergillus pseudoustus]|uniref:Secreted protein n=1 Tax=Aspergillus pseudoustus TaxID=1810923 RepID=A0ABR4KFP2_9EURO
MKFSTVIALLPVWSALVHGAALSRRSSPIEGYTLWQPEWEIESSPGKTIKVRGTVQQVRDEVLKVNPNWEAEYIEPARVKREAQSSPSSPEIFAKRTDFQTDGRVACGRRWEQTSRDDIMRGIFYLRDLPGQPTNGPGPGACGRVSCSYGAAIWWCNDDDQPKTLESYGSIADGAMAIVGKCSYYKPGSYIHVSGQAFHNTNWNVIVREDDDNC